MELSGSNHYIDYIIIGSGAAGLHLMHAMSDDRWFSGKSILVIDKYRKNINDRTWCFWESGQGRWDGIASRIWENGWFNTSKVNHALSMYPYRYKMIRGIDFYELGRKRIAGSPNIKSITADVSRVEDGEKVRVFAGDQVFTAGHVFDSRIDPAYEANKHRSVHVLQHFLGWVVETDHDVFNDHEFIMMDYRIKHRDLTGFTYVLPYNRRKALVEFTFFTPQMEKMEVYEGLIRKYLKDILQISEYRVTEDEFGVIPMTTYPFHQSGSRGVTKIGTAGSWVKPSSGYSFKNAEKMSRVVVENLRSGREPDYGIGKKRFRLYDTLFLEILQNRNELGEEIFTDMYLKNPTSAIFKFLDEETSLTEDLKIISSFRPAPFRKALMKHWREIF